MNTIRICPSCGAALPPDAPTGLCPVCLLKSDPEAKGPSGKPAATIRVSALTRGASAEPAATLTINPAAGTRVRYFGDYELQEEIARGGMGVVWKARQASLNRTVALKMILAGKLAGEAEVQRFHREAKAAANLQHPNIVAIHEVGEHDGQHYYSMDYVAGRDLGTLVRESGPLPSAHAAECLRTIAEAVHFAHQRGTLHRDLKPQNVLIDAAGRPRITDFGLAKFIARDDSLTQTGTAMGSPSYMPPEQAAGHLDQVGPPSDVYALGAILYELLTGRPPFRADTALATMRQVMESDPVAPRKLNTVVPPDLETICLKCLEKNPTRRYHSARALAEELGRFLNHEPIQARPVSGIRRAESWLRRHPWTLLAAASLVVMVLTGLLYWQFERLRFLENRPLVTDEALRHTGWRGQELKTLEHVGNFMVILTMWTVLVFRSLAFGKLSWRHIFEPHTIREPDRPASQRGRITAGLIGVAAFGFSVLYLAKVIQVSVWETPPKWSVWLIVYPAFYFSLALLLLVARDYLNYVHGMPSRTLSTEQSEALRQAIFERQLVTAIKLYRRTMPDASLAEARDYVRRLTAELMATQPEKFAAPPKPWDLNWRLMIVCLVVGFGVFAGFWMMRPPAVPSMRLLGAAVGFVYGAGACFLMRLAGFWRVLGWILVLAVLPVLVAFDFSQLDIYLGGLAFGACLILSGSARKWPKSTPAKRPSTDGSPSL